MKAKYPCSVLKGKDFFDANVFRDKKATSVFYNFVAELKDVVKNARVTRVHQFLKDLDDRGVLGRCYTQNVDGLEKRLGLEGDLDQDDVSNLKVVPLHGDLDHVVCTLCAARFDFDVNVQNLFRDGESPGCPSCLKRRDARQFAGKRPLATGTLRPSIVLYNEDHAKGDLISEMVCDDVQKEPDLMIVIGTSLKVHGIKNLVRDFAKAVHSCDSGRVVFINRVAVSKEWNKVFDYCIIGDADDIVDRIWSKMCKPSVVVSHSSPVKRRRCM